MYGLLGPHCSRPQKKKVQVAGLKLRVLIVYQDWGVWGSLHAMLSVAARCDPLIYRMLTGPVHLNLCLLLSLPYGDRSAVIQFSCILGCDGPISSKGYGSTSQDLSMGNAGLVFAWTVNFG